MQYPQYFAAGCWCVADFAVGVAAVFEAHSGGTTHAPHFAHCLLSAM
jgi:hypothetical protein